MFIYAMYIYMINKNKHTRISTYYERMEFRN